MFIFLSSVSRLNSHCFSHFLSSYHLIYLNPCNCFCALPSFPCEFLIRVFFCHHHHSPPSPQTPNLLHKHKQWDQNVMPPLQAKRHKIQSLWQFFNENVPTAPILTVRICWGLFLEIPLRLDKLVSCAITCSFHQVMESHLQKIN